MAAVACLRIAMTSVVRGILMMPEGRALRGRHRGHALHGHDERESDSQDANESQSHCRIVSQRL